tara:strand:+ start:357 stop:467 length:111 start_codon:yes stop_codon:yes gene_type:complete
MSKYDKGPETIQETIDRLQDYYDDPTPFAIAFVLTL